MILKQVIYFLMAFEPALAQAQTNCVNSLRSTICLVEQANDDSHADERPCLPTPVSYQDKVLNVLLKMPAEVQPIICHLKRIYIEKDFYATGYASDFVERVPERDDDESLAFRKTGWVIGLSEQKVFLENWTLNNFLAQKDQTLFGRDLFDPVLKDFPRLEIQWPNQSGEEAFLYDVLLHEIGHLLDFANKVNNSNYDACFDDNGDWIEGCHGHVYGAWSLLTWQTSWTHRTDSAFFDRPLCFYNHCEHQPDWKPISLDRAEDFYTELIEEGQFVSTYAPASPMEDFAESLVYYFLENTTDAQATLHFPSQNRRQPLFGTDGAFKSSFMVLSKFDYIKRFFNSKLQYSPKDTVYWIPKDDIQPKIRLPHHCSL